MTKEIKCTNCNGEGYTSIYHSCECFECEGKGYLIIEEIIKRLKGL